jgi:1-acyl-sn-glycerol-3-phosphate acyltransferase
MAKKKKSQLLSKVINHLLSDEDQQRFELLKFNDQGLGYDKFGMSRDVVLISYAIWKYLYDYYFRVESSGHEHVPTTGRTILVGNHSGILPLDAAMIGIDIAAQLNPPRFMRAIVERFAADLPYVCTYFARAGQVIGTRRNFEELLKAEEMIVVFPEGVKGPIKPYRLKYQLQYFNVGFIELALLNKTPLVPVAVVGAEEQAPMLGDLKPLAKALGVPTIPITPTFPFLGPFGMLPYPVKYHISYGEPLHFYKDYPPETVSEPKIIRQLSEQVKEIIQGMVDKGLEEREGVFI